MPADFQTYVLTGVGSPAEVDALAQEPDLVWHDNIAHVGGAGSSAGWYHSHKLVRDAKGRLRHVAGAVRTPLAAIPWLIIREKHNRLGPTETRQNIARLLCEASHYSVDATTLPHLTRELSREEHDRFEIVIRDHLGEILAPADPLVLPRPRDVGGSVPIVCRETYLQQIHPVRAALAANRLEQETALLRQIVARCLAFTLAVWQEYWKEI